MSLALLPASASAAKVVVPPENIAAPIMTGGGLLPRVVGNHLEVKTSDWTWNHPTTILQSYWQGAKCDIYPYCDSQYPALKWSTMKNITGTSYTPTATDKKSKGLNGRVVRYCIKVRNSLNKSATLCSPSTGSLMNRPSVYSFNNGVRISRNAATLSATSSVAWVGELPSLLYQWQRTSCSNLKKCSGWKTVGTNVSYTLTSADRGKAFRVCVKARNSVGISTESVCSAPLKN